MAGLIQGIDGGALLAAFRQGRSDRQADDKAKAAAEKAQELKGVMGQLFGEQSGGGVTGQYAPNTPQGAIPSAFTPDQPAAAVTAPAASPAPAAPRSTAPQINQQALAKLMVLDPETGGKITNALKDMSEMTLKQAESRNSHLGASARWLRQFPVQERAARLQQIAPLLMENGVTAQQLQQASTDLSDQALQYFEMHAVDYDHLIDNELAARKQGLDERKQAFDEGQPKIILPQAGAGAFAMDPKSGNITTLVAPNDGTKPFGSPAGGTAGIAQPKSKADFDALPPGAKFIAPDGSVRQKPGGPTQPASGGF